jgi:hypothetical protein
MGLWGPFHRDRSTPTIVDVEVREGEGPRKAVGVEEKDVCGGEKVDGESGTYGVRFDRSISYSDVSSSGGAATSGVVDIQRLKWEVAGIRGDDRASSEGGAEGGAGVSSRAGRGDAVSDAWVSLNGSSRVVEEEDGTAGGGGGGSDWGSPVCRDRIGWVSDPWRSGCFRKRSLTGAGLSGAAPLDPGMGRLGLGLGGGSESLREAVGLGAALYRATKSFTGILAPGSTLGGRSTRGRR